MDYQLSPGIVGIDTVVDVNLSATLDCPLHPGDSVAFALPESWSSQPYCITYTREPQITAPAQPDYATVTSPGATLSVTRAPVIMPNGAEKGHVRKVVATITEGEIGPGQIVTLHLKNYRSTWLAERARFRVWVNELELDGVPCITTVAQPHKRLRVILPSSARPGEDVAVQVVSLDAFWNLSTSHFSGCALRRFDGQDLLSGISFTGRTTLTTTIADEGIHRLAFVTPAGDHVVSNPIRITNTPRGPFWGDLHGHDRMHNCGAGAHPFVYARWISCLDFVGVAPDFRGLCLEAWDEHVRRTNAAHSPGAFTTLLSYEYGFNEGHHNVIYRGDSGPRPVSMDQDRWHMDAVVDDFDPTTAMLIPHHLAIHWRPQEGYFPERDPWIPLMEIYSQHGLSECYAPEHSLSYEHNRTRGNEDKYASSTTKQVYARDAWAQGRRYGVIASSDDHMGQPGKPNKGLAAVTAPANEREAIFDALKGRATYATTGERILIDLSISGAPMGGELTASVGERLEARIEIHGTDQIAFVQLMQLKQGQTTWGTVYEKRMMDFDAFHEEGGHPDIDFADTFTFTALGDSVTYLRMAQRKQIDGYPVYAWTSPVWVTVD